MRPVAETPREMWQFRPAPGAWSVHEIIVHLADSELNAYARVRKALANIAREAGIGTRREFMSFDVKTPKGARLRGSKAVPAASRYYVAVYRPRGGRRTAAVAKEFGGRIIGNPLFGNKSPEYVLYVRHGSTLRLKSPRRAVEPQNSL